MKTTLSSCFKSTKSIRCALSILAASAALSCQGFAEQIVADFTDGNSDAMVDGWYGKSGDGWATAWTRSSNGGTTESGTVQSTFSTGTKTDNPLTPSGEDYLRSKLKQVDGIAAWSSVVARQYDQATIDFARNHTVRFEFRLDSALDGLSKLMLFDGTEANRDATAAEPTWYIHWEQGKDDFALYDGKTQVRSGVDLVAGEVYRFTIDIAPSPTAGQSTYSVVIENLTTAVTSEKFEGLHFYTDKSSVGGFLNFAGNVSTPIGSEFTFSLDSIHITAPELSSLSLIGAVAGAIWLLARRRRRGSLGRDPGKPSAKA